MQESIVQSPDMRNRIAVGKPRTYRDRDCDREKSALGFNADLLNSNSGHAVGAVQIPGRQTDITKCRNVLMMHFWNF